MKSPKGFSDYGDMWRVPYESKTFTQDMERLYRELRPLYQQLHAYVRRNLRRVRYNLIIFSL